MPKGRLLKPQEVEMIKKLSQTHYPKEIARIIGCTPHTVRNIQRDPRHGIVNPKTKFLRGQQQTRVELEGYFDIEKWAREMAF
jgi:hypothetical protein